MSAIKCRCRRCGAVYFSGMVGSTPWPRHQCWPDHRACELIAEAWPLRHYFGVRLMIVSLVKMLRAYRAQPMAGDPI